MLYPLAASVRAALSHADPGLIPPGAARRIEAAAAALPSALRGFGFECRLGADGGPVDFGGSVAAEGGGREVLAALREDAPPGAALLTRSAWRAVRDFAIRWGDPQAPFLVHVPVVFLELDLDADDVPAPSVFVRLRSGVGEDAALDVVRALAGERLAARVEASLRHAFTAMPRGGSILDVAVMLGRGAGSVRLFASAPARRLPGYLEELGWAKDDPALRDALSALYGERALVPFQIDVADVILPRLGLELSFAPEAGAEWQGAVERLVDLGLCAPDKRGGLLGWPGRSREPLPGVAWPCVLVRTLSHLKVVLRPGAWVEAKGYLWAEPRFSLVC